jgi:hypothetical protein
MGSASAATRGLEVLLSFKVDSYPALEDLFAILKPTKDCSLAGYAFQFIAATYLWNALIAHRHSLDGGSYESLTVSTTSAISFLKDYLRIKRGTIPVHSSESEAGQTVLRDRQNKPPKTKGTSRVKSSSRSMQTSKDVKGALI